MFPVPLPAPSLEATGNPEGLRGGFWAAFFAQWGVCGWGLGLAAAYSKCVSSALSFVSDCCPFWGLSNWDGQFSPIPCIHKIQGGGKLSSRGAVSPGEGVRAPGPEELEEIRPGRCSRDLRGLCSFPPAQSRVRADRLWGFLHQTGEGAPRLGTGPGLGCGVAVGCC